MFDLYRSAMKIKSVYQVTIHARGLDVVLDDGEVIRGFYTFRKVKADTIEEAKELANLAVIDDERTQAFIKETEEKNGLWRIEPDKAFKLNLRGRLFHRVPKGFVFYQ